MEERAASYRAAGGDPLSPPPALGLKTLQLVLHISSQALVLIVFIHFKVLAH